jgi:polyisoprenoid-binding protein YceI
LHDSGLLGKVLERLNRPGLPTKVPHELYQGVSIMRMSVSSGVVAGLLAGVLGTAAPLRADEFTLDAAHAAVTFKISHLGLSWTHGRFNDLSGSFTIDKENPAKSTFALSIKTESIDTGVAKRDDHLRSPDFFNAKQFPAITFKTATVKPVEGGYEVTGDFTMHGVTKPVTLTLKGGRTAEFPKGVMRTGYSTDLTIKRSDFGIDKFKEGVGDEVFISISFEGTKK